MEKTISFECGQTRHVIFFKDSRDMSEIRDNSVHLVVTSPPYPMIEMWDDLFSSFDHRIAEVLQYLKEKGKSLPAQQALRLMNEAYDLMHEVLLFPVWDEISRVLVDGGIACINIGDATRSIAGLFRLYPNHAKTIEFFEKKGFVSLPYILWKKPTNKPNAFLGSGFLPPNAYVTLDVEYILLFRKGRARAFPPKYQLRYESAYTKEERDRWFTQIWDDIKGERQIHSKLYRRTASFPEEIPRRLIRMFSIKQDVVLDPFLGLGTTTKVAAELGRNSIGYEIDDSLYDVIVERLGLNQPLLFK
ncbi:DNA-methyltransferase [Thermovibrio sp.]